MALVPIEVSARHIHLSTADWTALFGDTEITSARAISQSQQYVATQRLSLRGPKSEFPGVGIVGPLRPYTQVELSMTDARVLGISAPLSDSGSLDEAAKIIIIGPQGEIERPAAIVPKRHVHIGPAEAAAAGVQDQQKVSVRIDGLRGAVLNDVLIRVHPDFTGRLHLDTDEGNACGVAPGMVAEIIA